MRIVGYQGSLPAGCFFLIRRDLKPRIVPALTIHRVPRRDAELAARMLAKSAGFAQGYDVVGLDHECDCLGRALMENRPHESESEIRSPICTHGIPIGACDACAYTDPTTP